MRRQWRSKAVLPSVLLALGISVVGCASDGGLKTDTQFVNARLQEPYPDRIPNAQNAADETEPLYGEYLDRALNAGAAPYAGETIRLPVPEAGGATADYALHDDGDGEYRTYLQSSGQGDGGGYVEWEVKVPETALYELAFVYDSAEGGASPPERTLLIDGGIPFAEGNRFVLPRAFTDEGDRVFAEDGSEIRKPVVELTGWRVAAYAHPERLYVRPYLVLLEQGSHTIRIADLREPVKLAALELRSPDAPESYEAYRDAHEDAADRVPDKLIATTEAETTISRSSAYLRPGWNRDPLATPRGTTEVRLNTIGGDKWRKGGMELVWEMEAPEDGWYEITARIQQNSLNRSSYRTIRVDGRIPFLEMEQYTFPYDRRWVNHTLRNADGEPFLFYLTKGTHTLSLESLTGPNRSVIMGVQTVLDELGELRREIQKVVSSTRNADGQLVADTERDWDLPYYIPDIAERLTGMTAELKRLYEELLALGGGGRSSETGILLRGYKEVEGYAADMETLPQKLNEFGVLLTSLSTVMQSLNEQTLELDKWHVHAPDADLPRGTATGWQKLKAQGQDFMLSFTTSRNKIGFDAGEDRQLTVSMARGREWGEVLSRLIDEEFTAETGIRVNINLLPLGSEHTLLLAYTADKAPDVALGVNPQIPVEFAMRGAVVDLSDFPDYGEVREQFYEGTLVPFEYGSGHYAVPETQDYLMTYYRTDILESLGLEPPETWEDVYAMLPVLRSNGMDFYFPPGQQSYTFFLYQNGGEFFRNGGEQTAIDTPEALNAFNEWTRLYTFHAMQKQADFYQRFRSGEMPVGVAAYDSFVKLISAAPELFGKWKMAPIPGTVTLGGSVDHTSGGVTVGTGNSLAAMIMETSDDKEAAWMFLKWWTSEEVQRRYADEIEAVFGAASRWNSANVAAFTSSNWTREEADTIDAALREVREQPVVPGGYYVTRQLLNAWNRVVLENEPPRIVLEDAVDEINRELRRKREEFGIE